MLGQARLQRLLGRRSSRIQSRIVDKGIVAVAMIRSGADRAVFDRECGVRRQQVELAGLHARNGAGHDAGYHRDGCIGGAQIADLARNASWTSALLLGLAIVAWIAVCLGVQCLAGDLAGGTKNVTGTIRRPRRVNVHGTFNLNPKFDLDGVCSLIRHWSPRCGRTAGSRPREANRRSLMQLAEAVGDHRTDARSIVTKDGDYGQALFSRWPFA